MAVHPASGREYEEAQSVGHSLRLLGEQPLAPTLFRRFANLGRFVAPYAEETNHPREVVEAALAHAVANQTEAAYARSDLFERRRRLMDEWAEYISR